MDRKEVLAIWDRAVALWWLLGCSSHSAFISYCEARIKLRAVGLASPSAVAEGGTA